MRGNTSGPQPQVVRNLSVEQMDIPPLVRIQIRPEAIRDVILPRSDLLLLQDFSQTWGQSKTAGAGILSQAHWRQETGHGRRSRYGPGHGELREIRAESIEEVLTESDPYSGNHVCAIDINHRTSTLCHVAEGSVIKDVLLIIFGGNVTPIELSREQPAPSYTD